MGIANIENQESFDPFAEKKQAHRSAFYNGSSLAIAIFNYLIGIDETARHTGMECSYPCPFPSESNSNHAALTTLLDAECLKIVLIPNHRPKEDRWPILSLHREIHAAVKDLRSGIGIPGGEYGSFHHLIGELLFRAFSRPIPESQERDKIFVTFAINLAECPRYQWHDSEYDNLYTLRYLLADIHTASQMIALNEPNMSKATMALYQTPVFVNLQPLFKSSMVSYPSTTAVIGLVSDYVVNGRYCEALNAINEFIAKEGAKPQSLSAAFFESIPVSQIANTFPILDAQATEPKTTTWDTQAEVTAKVKQYAATNANILIFGDPGTGKTFLAKQIHEASGRNGKFIDSNCSTYQGINLQNELFGHSKGAFTGADSNRAGKVKTAKGGTIFLDEIGDCDLNCRAMMLSFLQDKKIEPLGGDETETIDVRIIAATNKSEAIFQEERNDFFQRFPVIICLAPINERRDEIPSLIRPLFNKIIGQANKKSLRLRKNDEQTIGNKLAGLSYSFPKNIRSIEEILFKAISNRIIRKPKNDDPDAIYFILNDLLPYLPT